MAKSKIIIADTDEQFLMLLEMKFVEELDDSIELETITDASYFEEYFSSPKSADALLVSERLFELSNLQKHSIGNIFILVEANESTQPDGLGINRIYKYTSTKDIFDRVSVLSLKKRSISSKQETVVALFYSASGGVGKSTLALGVSYFLSNNNNRVLYINASRLNTFQYKLSNSAAIPNSALPDFSNNLENVYSKIKYVIRNEGFDYLPPFSRALSTVGIDNSVYLNIVRGAKMSNNYDVIIVDADCTFDKDKTDLITLADRVIIVTEQTMNSVYSTNVLTENISFRNNEKFRFVCNKYISDKSSYIMHTKNYIINEYVKYFENCDTMSIGDLSKKTDIQKVAYLMK